MKINQVINEGQQNCPECGGPAFSDLLLAEKKDACYNKVRSRYKVWPSAYASGALVQCRKKGAANWGNKTKNEGVAEGQLDESNTIDFIRGLISEFNTQMSGSPYYPMDYKNPGMRMWTRGDGSRYKDPGYIFIDRDLKPEDQPKWHKAKAVEKFWKFLESKGARKIGDVSGEFGSDSHSPAVVLNKLIFVFNGRSIAWGSTSRLKNSSVWRQKQQGVAEMDSQGYTGSRDRKKTSKYGSRDHYNLGGPESTGRPLTAKQMTDRAHKAMLKSMSNNEKVDKGWRNPNIDEGAGNIGNSIKALYQKIYRAGDDEIEYFYNDSPIFAQYWDEYEGDLDSIIAEVDPGELQVMLDELESYVQQANLAEADYSPMAKDAQQADRIRSLKNLIAIARDQGRQLRVQELELELKKLQGVAEGSEDLASLRAKAKEISDKIDTIVKDGGRVGFNDPLSRQLKAIRAKIQQAKKQGVAEADKHSMLGKIQRHQELKKKVDTSFADIGKAQQAGDHPAASKAFRKHERYANLERPGTWTKVDEQDVAEGVAETVSMNDAVKVLRHYGAEHFKTTSNELHFYKNGQPMSVDLIWGADSERSVSLSQLNSVSRQLKGQGVAEGDISQLEKDVADAPVKPIANMESATDSDGYSVDQEDAGEYDYEGDQAKDQLQTIVAAARKLDSILDDNENMPEWVQMKITKATDYLDTAADYVAANKAQAEPMAEADQEKIGGRHDPEDFDDMVLRLKKLAGAGPMKTVYDPNTRRYKNMPTAVQPQSKK